MTGGESNDRIRHAGRPLLALTLGHATVDSYVGLIAVLYPLMIARFSLDLAMVGLVTLAYVGVASASQPLFGWLADRYGVGVLRFSLVWTVVVFAAVGFAPSFEAVLVLVAAAGLGSGAYHPFGAVGVGVVAKQERRGTATSVYVMGGYVGAAAGPIAGAALVPYFGLGAATLMILPGLVVAAWLLRDLGFLNRTNGRGASAPSPRGEPGAGTPAVASAARLVAVMGVMMSQAWVLFAVQSFAPTWYDSLGYGPAFYGSLLTIGLLATGLGNVLCGILADRHGKRTIVAGAMAAGVPALLAFGAFPGPAGLLTSALVGLTCASTGPLLLIMAQQLLPGREGLASGLVLGVGFLTAAVGVPLTGLFADAFGLREAMLVKAGIAAVTLPLVLFLPGDKPPGRSPRG